MSQAPNRRVALVAFNGDVTIYGDGSLEPRVIAGDRLQQHEYLATAGSEYVVERRVADCADALNKRVFELSETGPTALGPAVVVAVSMAARARGSKVVVCTDGLANVGLGSVDEDAPSPAPVVAEGVTTPDESPAEAFYRRVGEFAASKGVTIDVLGWALLFQCHRVNALMAVPTVCRCFACAASRATAATWKRWASWRKLPAVTSRK